jgi:hypothetical protein
MGGEEITNQGRVYLTPEQSAFISRHKIAINEVFDAKGMTRAEYSAAMKSAGKQVAINVTPCAKGKHEIRTASGNCAVCNTASIGISRYKISAGYLYIAMSSADKLLKVGFTTQRPQLRVSQLSEKYYGSSLDWTLVAFVRSKNAGRRETELHGILRKWALSSAEKDALGLSAHEGRELFSCDYTLPLKAFKWLNEKYRCPLTILISERDLENYRWNTNKPTGER